MSYVRRIQADPDKSLVGDVDYSKGFQMPEDTRMTRPRLAILIAFAGGIAFFCLRRLGDVGLEFFLVELAGIFMGTALFAAIVAGLSPNRVTRLFCAGAAELTAPALLIGFAAHDPGRARRREGHRHDHPWDRGDAGRNRARGGGLGHVRRTERLQLPHPFR